MFRSLVAETGDRIEVLMLRIQPGIDAKLRGARDFPGIANAWVEAATAERSPYTIAAIPAAKRVF